MYFDNTWLTYCLLLGIAMFFTSTFIVAVFLKALHEERTDLRNTRKLMENTIAAYDEAHDDLDKQRTEFQLELLYGKNLNDHN